MFSCSLRLPRFDLRLISRTGTPTTAYAGSAPTSLFACACSNPPNRKCSTTGGHINRMHRWRGHISDMLRWTLGGRRYSVVSSKRIVLRLCLADEHDFACPVQRWEEASWVVRDAGRLLSELHVPNFPSILSIGYRSNRWQSLGQLLFPMLALSNMLGLPLSAPSLPTRGMQIEGLRAKRNYVGSGCPSCGHDRPDMRRGGHVSSHQITRCSMHVAARCTASSCHFVEAS